MADNTNVPKVDRVTQAESDTYYVKKMEQSRLKVGNKVLALKGRNKMIGALLAVGAVGVYSYTMLSVQKGQLLDEFDRVPK